MWELMRRRDQGDSEAEKELEEMSRNNTFDMFTLFTASGVYLHGLAGDIARDLYGEISMVASNIIDCIGEALDVARKSMGDKFAYIQQ
jgi:hypothetical protein